jgi:hypothetical protein
MGNVHPNFYKFYSRSTADVVLRNGTLRWSRPGTFNDPFDCQFDLYFPPIEAGMREEAIEKIYQSVYEDGPVNSSSPMGKMILGLRGRLRPMARKEFSQTMGHSIDEVLSNFGKMKDEFFRMTRDHVSTYKILCLSDRVTSILMWSHYADHHSGLALRFDTPDGVDSPWSTAQPLHYCNSLPLAMSNKDLVDFVAGRYVMDGASIAESLIMTKAVDWQYENEWRLTSGSGRNPQEAFEDAKFNPRELTGIVLGARMSAGAKSHFARLARALNPDVEVLQASLATKSFEIEVSPAEGF